MISNLLILGEKRERIVGGTTIVSNSWPWLVSVSSKTINMACHGAIIHSSWILTVAHCCNQPVDSYIGNFIYFDTIFTIYLSENWAK